MTEITEQRISLSTGLCLPASGKDRLPVSHFRHSRLQNNFRPAVARRRPSYEAVLVQPLTFQCCRICLCPENGSCVEHPVNKAVVDLKDLRAKLHSRDIGRRSRVDKARNDTAVIQPGEGKPIASPDLLPGRFRA